MVINTKNISKRLRAIYGIWYRELLLFCRNRARLFTAIFLPLLGFLVFGTGFKLILSRDILGYDFNLFFFPGLLAVSVAIMAFDATMSIVWDKEFGFLKEILVSPVSRVDIALGRFLGAVTRSLIQGLPLMVIAPFIGIPMTFTRIVLTILTIIVLCWGVAGIGIILASRIKRLESFGVIMQMMIGPMVVLSGAFFPIHNASAWLRIASNFNPLTYGVDSLRFILLESSVKARIMDIFTTHNFLVSAIVAVAIAVVTTYFGILAFKKMK